METIKITGEDLTFEDVVKVACENALIELGDLEKVKQAENFIARKVDEGKPIYGVNTGFGAKADQIISLEDTKEFQINLLRSHSTGRRQKFSDTHCPRNDADSSEHLDERLFGHS